jgi:hypothetical protein
MMEGMNMGMCFKPHPLLHTLGGIGIGFLIVLYFPSLTGSTLLTAGLVLFIGAIVGEFFFTNGNCCCGSCDVPMMEKKTVRRRRR